MQSSTRSIFIICFILLSSFELNARDFSAVELKTIHVRGKVYMLEGVHGFAGGNIGISVGEDGILLVDDQFAEMNKKIRKAISELGSDKPRFILNTHWHGDHTGGNELFSQQATVIAHSNVRKRLMHEQTNAFSTSPAKPKEAWPVITFDEALTIHFNDETIRAMHFPNGHTDGDSVIYFTAANVVHMGDHFFNGMFPFVDISSGGNVVSFKDNIQSIIDSVNDDVIIIPGHGPLSNKQELIRYHGMLEESIEYVKNSQISGLSLQEIIKKGLPENLKKWETGFIKADAWITFIHQSL